MSFLITLLPHIPPAQSFPFSYSLSSVDDPAWKISAWNLKRYGISKKPSSCYNRSSWKEWSRFPVNKQTNQWERLCVWERKTEYWLATLILPPTNLSPKVCVSNWMLRPEDTCSPKILCANLTALFTGNNAKILQQVSDKQNLYLHTTEHDSATQRTSCQLL